MISFILLFLAPYVQADTEPFKTVEVPVMQAFIPVRGYDDNDRVTAVVMGELPNPCYTLDGVQVIRDDIRKTFYLKQLATLNTTGACGHGDLIDDPVPYSSEVTLGQVAQGTYRLIYRQPGEKEASKAFYVQQAEVNTLDNFNYAFIDHIAMNSYYGPNEEVTAEISGVITSSCVELEKPVRIEQQGDLFIVLPVLKTLSDVPCTSVRKTFHYQIELGKLPPGQYAIHVRSRNGRAVNHVMSVVYLPTSR